MSNTSDYTFDVGGADEEVDDGMASGGASGASKKKKPGAQSSILDQFRALVQATVDNPSIRAKVPLRPEISLQMSPNITADEFKAWRKRHTNKKTGELNSLRFSCMVIQNTLEGIYLDDELVVGEGDEPVTFTSDEIQEMFAADDAYQAIQDLFSNDPNIESLALTILDRAGWGDEPDVEENPT